MERESNDERLESDRPRIIRFIFRPESISFLSILVYIIYFSVFTIARHKAFMTQGFDLSVYVQMLWNSLNGDFFKVTIQPGRDNYLQHHFAPSMALFVPLYGLWKTPEWLLFLQTSILASGSWPIFRVSSQVMASKWIGLCYGIVYLLYPALQAANLYDFHEVTIAAPLLAWAWFFSSQRRWVLFFTFCLLALGFREEVVIFIFGIGILLVVNKPSRRAGFGLLFLCSVWFVFLLWMSFYQSQFETNAALYFQSRFGIGSHPLETLRTLVYDPILLFKRILTQEKLSYLLNLFAPGGYLSFLAWESIFTVIPYIGLNLLGNYWLLISPAQAQYNVLVVPFIVLTSAWGASRLLRFIIRKSQFNQRFWNSLLATYLILLSFGYQLKLAHLPFSPYFKWPQISARHLLAEHIADQIPQSASLSVQDHLAPHASHRRNLYIFPVVNDADFIFLDLDAIQALKVHHIVDLSMDLTDILEQGQYETVIDQDRYLLFKRKY